MNEFSDTKNSQQQSLATNTQQFAGREKELAAIHQYLVDDTATHAFTFLGRRRIGKSAILQHVVQIDAPTWIGIYFPLKDIFSQNKQYWLRTLSQSLLTTIVEQGFVIDNLFIPDSDPELAAWFMNDCLPTIFRAIRQQHLVILIDDVVTFLHAPTTLNEQFPTFFDIVTFLRQLIQPRFKIVVAANLFYEDDLEQFGEFINRKHLMRLTRLSLDETAIAIRQQTSKECDDDAIATIYHETGGEPAFLHHFGNQLAATHNALITNEGVKAILQECYTACKKDIELILNNLRDKEPSVLKSISTLFYLHPLRTVNTLALEQWLVQTDHTMDATTINRTFRSLEYAGIVKGTTSDMQIAAGVIHKWLLERSVQNLSQIPEPPDQPPASWRSVVIATLILLILVLLIVLSLSGYANGSVANTPIPTAPLSIE